MGKTKLLPYEKGQDYVYLSDMIDEKLQDHEDDKELMFMADKFRAYLGDRLDKLDSHVFGVYNSDNFKKDYGEDYTR